MPLRPAGAADEGAILICNPPKGKSMPAPSTTNDLLDLVMGKAHADGAELAALVEKLKAT